MNLPFGGTESQSADFQDPFVASSAALPPSEFSGIEREILDGEFDPLQTTVTKPPKKNNLPKIIVLSMVGILVLGIGGMSLLGKKSKESTSAKDTSPAFNALAAHSDSNSKAQVPTHLPTVASNIPVAVSAVASPSESVPSKTAQSGVMNTPSDLKNETVVNSSSALSKQIEERNPSSPASSNAPDENSDVGHKKLSDQVAAHTESAPVIAHDDISESGKTTIHHSSHRIVKISPNHKNAIAASKGPHLNPNNDTGVATDDSLKVMTEVSAKDAQIASFTDRSLIIGKPEHRQKYEVGDTLPAGDRITKLDAASMTVFTNRRVIRVIN